VTGRRAAWLAMLALAAALGACAHGSKNELPPAQAGPPQQRGGHLSVAEYRAIVREYRRLRPLQQGGAGGDALARGRTACSELRSPATKLVQRVRVDCFNAILFFHALRSIENAGQGCATGSTRDRIACVRDRYNAMANAIVMTRRGAVAINRELRRRDITGLCARSIGITAPQAQAYGRAERAARAVANAAAAGDPPAFQQATQDLTSALAAGSSGPEPLQGIVRACRPGAPKTLPRLPGDGVNA
jgi:hypothetical protein